MAEINSDKQITNLPYMIMYPCKTKDNVWQVKVDRVERGRPVESWDERGPVPRVASSCLPRKCGGPDSRFRIQILLLARKTPPSSDIMEDLESTGMGSKKREGSPALDIPAQTAKKGRPEPRRDEEPVPQTLLDTIDMTQTCLSEEQVGIKCYISTHLPAFSAILKHRFTDFLVYEVDKSGQVVRLKDISEPHEPGEEPEDKEVPKDSAVSKTEKGAAGSKTANAKVWMRHDVFSCLQKCGRPNPVNAILSCEPGMAPECGRKTRRYLKRTEASRAQRIYQSWTRKI